MKEEGVGAGFGQQKQKKPMLLGSKVINEKSYEFGDIWGAYRRSLVLRKSISAAAFGLRRYTFSENQTWAIYSSYIPKLIWFFLYINVICCWSIGLLLLVIRWSGQVHDINLGKDYIETWRNQWNQMYSHASITLPSTLFWRLGN